MLLLVSVLVLMFPVGSTEAADCGIRVRMSKVSWCARILHEFQTGLYHSPLGYKHDTATCSMSGVHDKQTNRQDIGLKQTALLMQ